MDKVKLKRFELQGSIGVNALEKTGTQRYWISIEIETDLSLAGSTDQLGDTVDYSAVHQMCVELMEDNDCNLIESYAERLAGGILERYDQASGVAIEVLKPDAPIAGSFEAVGIEINRKRNA